MARSLLDFASAPDPASRVTPSRGEVWPLTVGEVWPRMVGEVWPVTRGEVWPLTVGEAWPLTVSPGYLQGVTPQACQTRVKVHGEWMWPPKTQCVLMDVHLNSHSVAEWWHIFTILLKIPSFYKDMWDLQARWIKTISFYNDCRMLKHPCVIVVFVCVARKHCSI